MKGILHTAKTAGVESRRKASKNETAGDLAINAANLLFQENNIKPSDIDFLLFCTQSPDYFMPSTACILQNKLGIPTTAGAFSFDLGCSGYVYGLAIANSFVESGLAKNVLLLTADTISKYLHPLDKNRLLFGDAASATLISTEGMAHIGNFEKGTDGSGFEHIIIRNGGNRHRELTGNMLNTLRKMNKLSKDNFFVDLSDTGNTTSSTVPIGLVKSINTGNIHEGMNVMVAGFGVGLSWAATILKF